MSRRFQFRLGRLFLAVTFVTLMGSHIYTSWKLKQAREEIARMATELGRLNITDPTRLNVVAQPTYEDMIWRWRVHVPTERKYGIYSATRNIPVADGIPDANAGVQTVLAPGEYTITVAARPNNLGEWRLTIADPDGATTTTIEESDAAWLLDNPGHFTMQAGGHGNGTEAADSPDPFVLLKVNCVRKPGTAAAPRAPGETSEGILVWAEELGTDPPLTGALAPSGPAVEDPYRTYPHARTMPEDSDVSPTPPIE